MKCWTVRKCVCAVWLFIQTRCFAESQWGFWWEFNQQEAHSPNTIFRWVRQCVKMALSLVKSQLADLVQFACLKILPKCWHLSTAVQEGQHVCILKLYACLNRSVQCILHSEVNFHPYKIQLHNHSVTMTKGVVTVLLSLSEIDGW
jgi:hypothetical protein